MSVSRFHTLPVLNNCKPTARSGHCSIKIGNYILIYGGFDQNRRNYFVFSDLYIFDIYNKDWNMMDLKPLIGHGSLASSMTYANGNVFIFGGCDFPFGEKKYYELIEIKLKSKQARKISTPLLNSENSRYHSIMFTFNDVIYILGGTSGYGIYSDLFKYDSRKNTVLSVKMTGDIPNGMKYHHYIRNECLYLLGGEMMDFSEVGFETIYELNLRYMNWRAIKNYSMIYPPHLFTPRMAFNDKYGFLCGGSEINDRISSSIWRFSLNTLSWSLLEYELPVPVIFHSVALMEDGYLYVFGGRTAANSRIDKLQKVKVTTSALSSLCLHRIKQTKHLNTPSFHEICPPIYNK